MKLCTHCGATANPITHTPGSILIELILWCFFLIPGVIYSLWRLTNRQKNVCPICKGASMIPLNSPQAMALRQQWEWQRQQLAASAPPACE